MLCFKEIVAHLESHFANEKILDNYKIFQKTN